MKLHPHLIVKDARRAIEFYQRGLGAREVVCYADDKIGGHVVYAELAIGDVTFSLAEHAPDWKNHSPAAPGSPVILTLQVDDARAVGARMVEAGADVIFPIEDQFYGERAGRLRDPFGHLWLITQTLEPMSPEEIQRGVDAYEP